MGSGFSKSLGTLFCAVLMFRAGGQTPDETSLQSRIARMHGQTKTNPLGEPHPPRHAAPDTGGVSTTTVLSVAPNPALFGQPVTLTAAISPGSATGRVTFYDGVTVVGTAALVGGQATLTTALLAGGPRALHARFDGNVSSSASLSNTVTVTVVTPPASGLAAGAITTAGAAPYSVAIADFNEDGIPDLAAANAGDGTVSILAGSGNGSFALQPGFNTGSLNPYALVTGDFNGDGHFDVAVVNSAGHTVSILLGRGDGTLQAPILFGAGSQPFALAAADFNNDGILDLAVIDIDYQTVGIFLGAGDGNMTYAAGFGTGSDPWAIASGDFNGHGIPDLAIADSSSNTVQVMLGQGNGNFTSAAQLSTGLLPSGIATGDWNHDGKTDIAVAYSGFTDIQVGGGVEVFLGNGNGSFQPPVLAVAGIEPIALAAGDFNGDGLLDLVVANAIKDVSGANPTNLSLLAGNGDGSFQPPWNYLAGASPVALAVADFNGDHVPDVAAASPVDNGIAILTGSPAPCQFTLTTASPTVFDASGGSASISFASNSGGCPWTAASPAWITPAVPSGLGGQTIPVTIQPNQTGLSRAGALVVGGQSATFSQWETTQTYADVPVSANCFDAVNTMATKHITAGCAPDQYCPSQSIPRSQMAIFIVRGIYGGDNFTFSPTPHFNDVGPQSFGFAWIQKFFELGITTGCGSGNFCPSGLVSRAQMAIFLIRARYGATAVFDFPPTPYFTDVPTGSFGFNWIQRLKLDAITSGCGPTTYCPGNPVTRGDMAIFLMRDLFNQFLPVGAAVIARISPSVIPAGQSISATITGFNTSFAAGVTFLNPIPGITIGAVSVNGPLSLTVQLSASASAVPQPVSILAITGSQEAVLPNGLVIQ